MEVISRVLFKQLQQDWQRSRAVSIVLFIFVMLAALLVASATNTIIQDVAILKSIGFSLSDIRVQYVSRALTVLCLGIAAGTLAANTLGQAIVSLLGAFMGASRISFVINPVLAYILCPLALALTVTATTLASTAQMQQASISQMVCE